MPTFSFDPGSADPLKAVIGQVRLLIGDDNDAQPAFSDEVIAAVWNYPECVTTKHTAVYLLRALAAKAAGQPDTVHYGTWRGDSHTVMVRLLKMADTIAMNMDVDLADVAATAVPQLVHSDRALFTGDLYSNVVPQGEIQMPEFDYVNGFW